MVSRHSASLSVAAAPAPDAPVGQPWAPLTGLAAGLSRLLILAGVPAALFWLPILDFQYAARVTLGDLVFLPLWVTTLVHYLRLERREAKVMIAFRLLVLAVLPGFLAVVGAAVCGWPENPLLQLGLHMKRFGLAAILPLAMFIFRSERFFRLARVCILVLSLVNLGFAVRPDMRESLPISADPREMVLEDRTTGAISNPNDLAYVSILLLTCFLSLSAALPGRRPSRMASVVVVAAACLTCIVLSGSRSGFIALVAGAAYYLVSSRAARRRKFVLAALLLIVAAGGLRYNQAFRDRMDAFYRLRFKEPSLEARIEAQYVAMIATFENPLGVGFSHFPDATRRHSSGMQFLEVSGSDSIYFDTLLGAGFLGLASLGGVMFACWRLCRGAGSRNPEIAHLLESGSVSMLIVGAAAVAPASVFVSPAFFFMIGCAAALPAPAQAKTAPSGDSPR